MITALPVSVRVHVPRVCDRVMSGASAHRARALYYSRRIIVNASEQRCCLLPVGVFSFFLIYLNLILEKKILFTVLVRGGRPRLLHMSPKRICRSLAVADSDLGMQTYLSPARVHFEFEHLK